MNADLHTIAEQRPAPSDTEKPKVLLEMLEALWRRIKETPESQRPNCIMLEEFPAHHDCAATLQFRADKFESLPFPSEWFEYAKTKFA